MATAVQEISLVQPDDLAKPATQPSASLHREFDAVADLRLAEACRDGQISAFEKLYLQHGVRMKSAAMNLLGNMSDAEDVVQEVFLKVYRGIKSFRGHSSFSTWIYRILINCCRDLQRRGFRRHETFEEELNPEGREVSVKSPDLALRMTLDKYLARLPGRQREVFVLFEVEGFRHSEIAVMLDISEASSKNLLFEAKQTLRQRLMNAERPS